MSLLQSELFCGPICCLGSSAYVLWYAYIGFVHFHGSPAMSHLQWRVGIPALGFRILFQSGVLSLICCSPSFKVHLYKSPVVIKNLYVLTFHLSHPRLWFPLDLRRRIINLTFSITANFTCSNHTVVAVIVITVSKRFPQILVCCMR